MTDKWICLEAVDSTNAYCKRHKVAPDTVVFAPCQTQGKGRNGRQFVSQRGGAYFSVVRQDGYDLAQCVRYVLAAPLAVCRVLEQWRLPACIKWPNDVWVGQAKLCGVLVETMSSPRGRIAVVGVGINVQNDVSDVPCVATSLAQLGVNVPPLSVAQQVVETLEQLLVLPIAELASAIRPRLLTIGKQVVLPDGRQGVAVDINDDGALVVRCQQEEVIVSVGDVTIKEEIC